MKRGPAHDGANRDCALSGLDFSVLQQRGAVVDDAYSVRARSIAWSGAGLLAQPVIALLALPHLLSSLGSERFGLLSLAWALTVVSGLFDLGIGRATTKHIAEHVGRGDLTASGRALDVATRLSLLTGLVGCAGLVIVVLVEGHRAIRFDPILDREVAWAALVLAAAAPMQTLLSTYRGASEALQHFRGLSLARLALSAASFLAPLAAAQFSTNLVVLVSSLVLARGLACLVFRQLAWSTLPRPTSHTALVSADTRALLSAGGWFTVSAVITPLLVQADRFFIGALLSASAVASYVLPFDAVTQLLVCVTAVATVAFPSIAANLQRDSQAARQLFLRWLRGVAVLMAVVCAGTALALPVALHIWLGAAETAEMSTIGRWLCLGVWLNGMGAMFITWLHATGRIAATAFLHLMELPLYLALLVWLLGNHGVTGAAIAWVIRVGVDAAALAWMTMTDRTGRVAA
jgi:O-antigen/teichoic acid export membrane protein